MGSETRVVNKYKEEYDVYIGRGSKWGNPFSHKEGTKAEFLVEDRGMAISAYRRYLWDNLRTGRLKPEELLELDGKRLGCFCKPQDCHGDVIVAAINWLKERNNASESSNRS